jgi:membrane associated rhomboid family serine protease
MPKDRPPTVIGLIALSAAVFLFELAYRPLSIEYGAIPLVINGAFKNLMSGEINAGVFASLSRLFTAMFLHGSAEHVIYNMIFLWAFGSLCSKHLGKWTTLALFLFCGMVGNVAQCWLNPNSPAPIIGASGGIMAFEGIYLAIAVRWVLPDPDVWPLAYPIAPARMAAFGVVGVCFDFYQLMNHSEGNVAFGAHIGGFASGFLMAWLITYRFPTADYYIKAKWLR